MRAYIRLLSAAMIPLSACSVTDIVEAPTEQSHEITLNISAPTPFGFGSDADRSSRADIGSQLRLSVALYALEANASGDTPQPKATKEMIYAGPDTSVVLDVENEGDYLVTVFADYIPGGSQAVEGHYPDTFYDTTHPGVITAKTESGDFFCNDLRDCFSAKAIFTKGLNARSVNIELHRAVSRVLIAAPYDDVDILVDHLDVTACSHLPSYTFSIDRSATTGVCSSTAEPAGISAINTSLTPSGKELFFFYTFAGEAADAARPSLGEVAFTIAAKDGVKLGQTSRTIPHAAIRPAINHQMTVNGSQGWISAAPGADDITVTINPLPVWNEKPQTVTTGY